ncbi:DoxX family protein [Streptomyces sp. XM4011]|uniref:DoxX family protein n=1 Tax=Streptomyces TaxID=1883 RepID=UPI001FF81814|nr:DoxX family protein [Streptomyces sp. XM4011]MCK1814497.1 DoxX family protein [Streptomyces sp. XM4011]
MTSPTTLTSRAALDGGGTAPTGADLGLLVLRLAVGLTMAAHGTQKLFGWFDGGGLDGTGQFFEFLGYPSGSTMALVAGLSETLGGLGLALGLLTPLAGAAIVGTMINVIVSAHWDDPFLGGFELPLVLGLAAVALTLSGPGRYAVDHVLPLPAQVREHRLTHGLAALALALVVAGITLLIRN